VFFAHVNLLEYWGMSGVILITWHVFWSGVGWFCRQHLPCSVCFWCMLGGSVEVWTKNILYRSIEGQTHFSMHKKVHKKVSKWAWPSIKPKHVPLHSISNSTSKHAAQVERKKIIDFLCKTTIGKCKAPTNDKKKKPSR
jgi:hypothetical protein